MAPPARRPRVRSGPLPPSPLSWAVTDASPSPSSGATRPHRLLEQTCHPLARPLHSQNAVPGTLLFLRSLQIVGDLDFARRCLTGTPVLQGTLRHQDGRPCGPRPRTSLCGTAANRRAESFLGVSVAFAHLQVPHSNCAGTLVTAGKGRHTAIRPHGPQRGPLKQFRKPICTIRSHRCRLAPKRGTRAAGELMLPLRYVTARSTQTRRDLSPHPTVMEKHFTSSPFQKPHSRSRE